MSGFVGKDKVLPIFLEMDESLSEIEECIISSVRAKKKEKEAKLDAALNQIKKETGELALCLSDQRKLEDSLIFR